MKIQINYGDIEGSDPLGDHVTEQVEQAMQHHVERVTRIEVHLRDDKQKRGGPDDKRCTMEYRISGEDPNVVEARSGDIYESVRECASKLQRAVSRAIDRK